MISEGEQEYDHEHPVDQNQDANSDNGSDMIKEEENYNEKVQRIPTPINKMQGYHDKENNAQRLESIKDYLKKDN